MSYVSLFTKCQSSAKLDPLQRKFSCWLTAANSSKNRSSDQQSSVYPQQLTTLTHRLISDFFHKVLHIMTAEVNSELEAYTHYRWTATAVVCTAATKATIIHLLASSGETLHIITLKIWKIVFHRPVKNEMHPTIQDLVKPPLTKTSRVFSWL